MSVLNTGPADDTFAVAVVAIGRDGRVVASSQVSVAVPAGQRAAAAA